MSGPVRFLVGYQSSGLLLLCFSTPKLYYLGEERKNAFQFNTTLSSTVEEMCLLPHLHNTKYCNLMGH